MIDRTLTQSELLSMWERGEGQRPSRRALSLLSGTAPDSTAMELGAMPIGRRDAALLELREQLFGDAFSGVSTCPACGEEIELSFDAHEVRREDIGDSSGLRIVDGPYVIDTRLPSTNDLASIESIEDLQAARERLFARCVIQATHDGDPIAPAELPEPVVDAVARRMAATDPQADVQLDLDCPSCAHAWREPFDIVTFFWNELSVFARRLLGEVHDLASAYGWSEEQILDLSPARRNAYLEMLR